MLLKRFSLAMYLHWNFAKSMLQKMETKIFKKDSLAYCLNLDGGMKFLYGFGLPL